MGSSNQSAKALTQLDAMKKAELKAKNLKVDNDFKVIRDINPSLYAKRWTFIKTGLDDFRDGFPPTIDEYTLSMKQSFTPLIKHDDNLTLPQRLSTADAKKRLSNKEIFYSRRIPASERRRKRIDQVERTLSEHPLLLLPELDDSLPTELYEDVVDILDPNLLEMLENGAFAMQSNESLDSYESSSTRSHDSDDLPNYSAFLEKRSKIARMKDNYETYDRKASTLINDFCLFARTLGDDGPAFIEDSIAELFAPAFRKHKARSAVQVVQLGTIPLELRAMAGLQPVPPDPTSKIDPNDGKKKTEKYRYGAWYLKPSSWKRLLKEDKLEDPFTKSHMKKTQLEKKKAAFHEELAGLHGTKAFQKYLNQRGKKEPLFMRDIINISDS